MMSSNSAECEKNNESNGCPFEKQCGGCAYRSLSDSEYRALKLDALAQALRPLGTLPDFSPVFIAGHSRRRVTFGIVFNKVARWFGLNAAKSDQIVSVESCALLEDGLNALIPALRAFFTDKSLSFFKREGTGDVLLTRTDSGTDMAVFLPFEPDLNWRQALAAFAEKHNIARVSWKTKQFGTYEPILCLTKPVVKIGDFTVGFPAGGFLQPSVAGQAALTELVTSFVGKSARSVADLFCGAGTFALPLLVKKRKVFAYDAVLPSLQALFKASDGRIAIEERDLFKTPLMFDELNVFDAVVLDPPRAGAKAQCAQLAASDVPTVAYVSCNPETFVKDALALKSGGYELTHLTPVDQFIYSRHMELVARFARL